MDSRNQNSSDSVNSMLIEIDGQGYDQPEEEQNLRQVAVPETLPKRKQTKSKKPGQKAAPSRGARRGRRPMRKRPNNQKQQPQHPMKRRQRAQPRKRSMQKMSDLMENLEAGFVVQFPGREIMQFKQVSKKK